MMSIISKLKISLISFFVFLLIFPASSLAQDFSKVDEWLEENAGDMGGRAVLLIYKDGNIVYSRTVNDMSRRQKRMAKRFAERRGREADLQDLSPESPLPLASCSKWLSAALIMTFVDEGKLSLKDTVGKYLPVLSKQGKGNITISQCLSHTTGIMAPPLKESLDEMKKIQSMDEAIEKISLLPMEGEPGTVFHYSNAGLQIAGAVIEKISGRDFETLFQERIAIPLEMKNTGFGKGKVTLPAGGASGTPEDYIKFLAMILNKGVYNGKRILSEKSIGEMQLNRITEDVRISYSPAEAGNAGYGYGEWIMKASGDINKGGTVSSPGLFGSFPWINNDKKYCAFLMTIYIKSDGRGERYQELTGLVDNIID